MKTKGLYVYCAVLTAALIIAAAAALISENRFDTTFKSVPEITVTVNNASFSFPLIEHTAVKYKTSDSSYVLVSRGDLNDISNFYTLKKYETEYLSDGRLTVSTADGKYTIERLADDMKYIKYSVRAEG